MKTYNKLTSIEKTIFSNKSAIDYNFKILTNIIQYVLTHFSDPEVLEIVNSLLETHIESVDGFISKHLQPHENDNEKDTTCSAN